MRRVLSLVPPLLVLVAAAVAAAAVPPAFEPEKPATSFRAVLRTPRGVEMLAWRAPDALAVRPLRGALFLGPLVERGGTSYVGAVGQGSGTITTRAYAARPDAFSSADLLLGAADFVLAEARAGKLQLRTARLGGQPTFVARVFLPAQDCAGLPRGTRTLWLDHSTLLPRRIVDRRGRRPPQTIRVTYTSVNAPLPGSTFMRPRVGTRPHRTNAGFVRATPLTAAARLGYMPKLPSVLPRGFTLALSGWAPLSGRTGPEASNPRYRSLFAAVFRRGAERIDITQRLARPSGWRGDPFGGECAPLVRQVTRVGGVRAFWAAGPTVVPHLYWRAGSILYTVSGPLPRRELVRIAESLTPVRTSEP
jgi:hypothetical protein